MAEPGVRQLAISPMSELSERTGRGLDNRNKEQGVMIESMGIMD